MANLKINHSIKTNKTTNVFCHETYAQELFDLYEKHSSSNSNDEPENSFNNSIKNGKIEAITNNSVYVQSDPKQTLVINIERDRKFLSKLGELSIGDDIMFNRDSDDVGTASLDKVQKYLTLNKLNKALKGEELVFECTVHSRNSGGYFVKIEDVECYLPGSLASANKIIDFDSLLGKKVTVMVDSFLADKKCFIVSAKKWIAKQLPNEIKKLNFDTQYSGTITGSLSTGIFVEFNTIFTAFMHTSEMTAANLERFNNKQFKPGSKIDFYIKEISPNPVKIVISEKIQENIDWRIMKRDVEDMLVSGKVIAKDNDTMKVQLSDELFSDIPTKNLHKQYKLDTDYKFYVKSIYPDEKKIVLYEVKQK